MNNIGITAVLCGGVMTLTWFAYPEYVLYVAAACMAVLLYMAFVGGGSKKPKGRTSYLRPEEPD